MFKVVRSVVILSQFLTEIFLIWPAQNELFSLKLTLLIIFSVFMSRSIPVFEVCLDFSYESGWGSNLVPRVYGVAAKALGTRLAGQRHRNSGPSSSMHTNTP